MGLRANKPIKAPYRVFKSSHFWGRPLAPGSTAFKKLVGSVAASLETYPYFAIVDGFGAEDDRSRAEALLAGIALEGAPTSAAPKISFTRVTVNKTAARAEGQRWTAYSRTEEALGLHTDSSYQDTPHHIIAFQMIRPDPEGGETTLMIADDVKRLMPPSLLERLYSAELPFGDIRFPVLSDHPARPAIRYYRSQILESMGNHQDQEALDLMDDFEAAMIALLERIQFKLAPGQMLVINNWRVLHGRTALTENSNRMMLRYRVHHASWT